MQRIVAAIGARAIKTEVLPPRQFQCLQCSSYLPPEAESWRCECGGTYADLGAICKFTPTIDEAARLVVERADLYRAGKCGVLYLMGSIDALIRTTLAEAEKTATSAKKNGQ